MKKIATVKRVLNVYSAAGIEGVKIYLESDDVEILKNSWVAKIKKDLAKELWISVSMEIEVLLTKFNNYEEHDEIKYNEES